MNIFYLHSNPKTCAEFHTDKHVVKMILEYAQLMSTAHRILDGQLVGKKYVLPDPIWDSVIYKSTHANHPSAIWTRMSKQNYQWLFDMWCCLLDEYSHRYGRIHSSDRLRTFLAVPPSNIPDTIFTEPTPAMPDQYKVAGDSITSYRNYYLGSKRHMFKWKHREEPYWIEEVA